MKKLLILLLAFTGLQLSAQNIDKYKYIVVPEAYDFLGETDQYRLNSLTKFLFEENGFTTVMRTEEKPLDLQNDPCLGLAPNLVEDSGLFTTKIVLQLRDCYGNVVFATKEGTSRSKEYKEAYHESLREAFQDIQALNYEYKQAEMAAAPKKAEASENGVGEKTTNIAEAEVKATVKPEVVEAEVEEEIVEATEVIEEQKVENSTSEKSDAIYVKEGANFMLKSTEQGYALYPENSPEPIALLIATDNSGYIYNSLSQQGVASFDADQNLVVEYFSRQDNKKLKITYKLQD